MGELEDNQTQQGGLDEHLGHGLRCVDLINADPADLTEFNERVKSLNGKLTVLIHPFYPSAASSGEGLDPHRYVTETYKQRRDKFLGSMLQHDVPFVVFEPETTIAELPTTLAGYGKGTVYTVTTHRFKHDPAGGEVDWERFIATLKAANIGHVVLGGEFMITVKSEFAPSMGAGRDYLDFIKKMPELALQYPKAAQWIKEDLVPFGCAGSAAIHLLNSGIDVSLSPIATPNGGKRFIPMEWVDDEFY